jgi:hypothetical protein
LQQPPSEYEYDELGYQLELEYEQLSPPHQALAELPATKPSDNTANKRNFFILSPF